MYLHPLLRNPPRKLPNSVKLRRSRSFKVTEFGTNRKLICDFLLVIDSNLPPILHRFRDIALESPKSLYFSTPLWFNPPTEGFPWDDLRKILIEGSQMATVPNGVETFPKISIASAICVFRSKHAKLNLRVKRHQNA